MDFASQCVTLHAIIVLEQPLINVVTVNNFMIWLMENVYYPAKLHAKHACLIFINYLIFFHSDSPQKCTSCISASDYTYDESTHTCVYTDSCHSSCSTCKGPSKYHCLTCKSGYLLVDNKYCVSTTECSTYFSTII